MARVSAERLAGLPGMATLPPRLSLGAAMAYHGLDKLRPGAAEEAAPFFEQLGFRPGKRWVRLTALTELLAGASVVAGLGTRLAALGVLATQAVAIAKVHGKQGFDSRKGGYEYNLALSAMALALLLRGPEHHSVYSFLKARAERRRPRGLLGLLAPKAGRPLLLPLLA